MGILDSIKARLGGGSEEPAPPGGKMRQPPGREPLEGPGPEPGPASEPGPGRDIGPEPPADTGPGPSPPAEAPPGPRESERESGRRRPGPGSTLDVEREGRNQSRRGEDLDFQPPGDEPEPPRERGGRSGPDLGNPGGGRGRDRRGGREEGGEMPEPPQDYNLDLPEAGGEGDRLDRIEEQNQRIIGLLEEIRDSVGRRR